MGRRFALLLAAAVTIVLALAAAAQGATLAGRVTTQRGGDPLVGLSGARIEVYDASGSLVAARWTDANGDYGLPTPDGAHRVDVVADGYETQRREGVELSGDRNRLDATLTPVGEARLHGSLRDLDGRALEGLSVFMLSLDPFVFASTTVAADGGFSLTVPTGAYLFQFSGGVDDHGWSFFAPNVTLTHDREVTLSVPPIVSATVRALDDDGAPVADAQVNYQAAEVPRTSGGIAGTMSSWATATTGADGRATFHALAGPQGSGRLTITPGLAGYADTDLEPGYLRGGEQFDLQLTHAAQLRLSVRDGAGEPVTGANVAVDDRWAASGGDPVVVDAPEGRRFLSSIHSDSSTTWEFRSAPFALAGTQASTLRLPASEQRLVRVVDGDGEPVGDATVTPPWQRADDVVAGDFSGTLKATGSQSTTDRAGETSVSSFAGAQTDPEQLGTVTPPAGSALPEARFALTQSGTTTVVLGEAPRTVHVSGVVLDADGRAIAPLHNVTIDRTFVTSGEDGTFEADVEPGQHTIYVRAIRLNGTFTATADRSLEIRLPPRVTLDVRALGSEGRGVPGATVTLPYSILDNSFGDLDSGTIEEFNPSALTDASGVASFTLWAGTSSGRPGFVNPPEGSDYEPATFDLPQLGSDASIDVRLLGGPVSTGPQLDLVVTPDPLVRGDWWSVSRVAVQVTASDDDGVASLACSVDGVARTFTQTRTATTRGGTFYVNSEGRHTAACTAVDGVGRAASQERAVNLDLKNPAAPTASPDRPADNVVYGWWRDSVTVSFSDNGDPLLADGSAGSGVEPGSVPAPVTYDRSGTFVASGTVTDRAGRTSSAGRATVKVDADAPTSTLTCPANPVVLGGSASARWQDADGQSGLPNGSSGLVALDTSSIGSFAATHTAVDRVGHETVSSCGYQVVYAFAWRGNVQAAPALNAVAPGVSTRTVWFSIGGDQGRDPIANGWPQVEPVDCVTGASSGRASAATVAGPLAWDAVNGRYGIAWDVRSDLPSDSCAALRLLLDDGVEREARFAR